MTDNAAIGRGAIAPAAAFGHDRRPRAAPVFGAGCTPARQWLRPARPSRAARQAMMADLVADLPGVNTHVNYLGSIYDSGFASNCQAPADRSGCAPYPGQSGRRQRQQDQGPLPRAGHRGYQAVPDHQQRGDHDLDYVKSLGTSVVEAVECPNERDNASNRWGSDWANRMERFALGIYPKFKADPATRDLPLIGPSWAKTAPSPESLPGCLRQCRAELHGYRQRPQLLRP